MTQHGEEPAVVRGLSRRVKRTLRSAANVALTAGLALSVASACAMPLAPAPHIERHSGLTITKGTPAPGARRHSRNLPPHGPGPAAGPSADKSSSANDVAFHAAGVGTAAPVSTVRRVSLAISTPAAQLLEFGTKASRTRGQPEVA